MTETTVAILIATKDRPDDVRNALASVASQTLQPDQIIVLDDASEVPLKDSLDDVEVHDRVTWIRTESPSGVSGARNRLVAACSADIQIFLDDDAVFLSDDAIEHSLAVFDSHPTVGILSYRIETPDLPQSDYQVPFKRGAAKKSEVLDAAGDVSYYVGAAHAIRRDVFEQCGVYPEDFIYGHEELDLSYRALGSGFGIRYEPHVRVAHYTKPSVIIDRGRRSGELYLSMRNRIWLAYRNLPLRYAVSYVSLWSGYYLLVALKMRKPLTWLSALLSGFRGLYRQERRPVGTEVVRYLKKNHGRLWM